MTIEDRLEKIYEMTMQQGESIARQDEMTKVIYKALMGNGQPGLLKEFESIKAKCDQLPIMKTEIDDMKIEVDKINSYIDKAKGALKAVSIIYGIITLIMIVLQTILMFKTRGL